MDISRKHRDQRRDAPPTSHRTRPLVQDARSTSDFRYAARVHERPVRWEVVRDDRLVGAGHHEMHDPREDEYRSEQAPHARELYCRRPTDADPAYHPLRSRTVALAPRPCELANRESPAIDLI